MQPPYTQLQAKAKHTISVITILVNTIKRCLKFGQRYLFRMYEISTSESDLLPSNCRLLNHYRFYFELLIEKLTE